MSDQTSKTSDSTDLKQSPRLTMRRLEAADPIELKPTSFDEFDAAVSARTPSTPVVKLESSTKFGSSAKPSSPTQTTGVAPSASTGFGDFGAEVERRVRRSAPSAIPASSRPSSDADSNSRVRPQAGAAKASQSAPRPSATSAPKPAPNLADQPIFKPTPVAPVTPVSAAPTTPATPRFDPKTGKPLASAQNSSIAQQQRQKSSSAPTPRFDPKTGKPLAGSQENPFVNSVAQSQKQKSPSPTIPRFDPKTGKPLATGQKASNDLYGGLSKEEFENLRKAMNESPQPKKKAPQIGCLPAIVISVQRDATDIFKPQIGCLPAIVIVGVFAALFQETGVFIGVFGIFVVNAILKAIFGDNNANSEEKKNS